MTSFDDGPGESTDTREKRRAPLGPAAMLVIAVAAVWFVIANGHNAKIRFWIPEVSAPMWLVLAGTFVVGGIFGFMTHKRRGG